MTDYVGQDMPNDINIELIDTTYKLFIIQYEFNSDNNYTTYCCREYDPLKLDEGELLCPLSILSSSSISSRSRLSNVMSETIYSAIE